MTVDYSHPVMVEMKTLYRAARDFIEGTLMSTEDYLTGNVAFIIGGKPFEKVNNSFLNARRNVAKMQIGFKSLREIICSAEDLSEKSKADFTDEIRRHQEVIEGDNWLGVLEKRYLDFLGIPD